MNERKRKQSQTTTNLHVNQLKRKRMLTYTNINKKAAEHTSEGGFARRGARIGYIIVAKIYYEHTVIFLFGNLIFGRGGSNNAQPAKS